MEERRIPIDIQIYSTQGVKEKNVMSKKVSTVFSLIVLLTLILSACGGAATPAPTEPPATAAPATAEPTATTPPTEAPEEVFPPEVKAVITITLPADATWSDGTPLTTKDVVGKPQRPFFIRADSSSSWSAYTSREFGREGD